MTYTHNHTHARARALVSARICPVSSESEGIKVSIVYLQSDAKELLRNNLPLHQCTVSSVSGGLWSSTGKHFVLCFRSVFSRPFEWPEFRHNHGVSVLVSVVRIKEKSQYEKFGEYGACGSRVSSGTDKSSLTDNTVCGHELSFRRNHFPVAHNSGQRRRTLWHKRYSTPFYTSWFTVWPCGTNFLCTTPLQSKKKQLSLFLFSKAG